MIHLVSSAAANHKAPSAAIPTGATLRRIGRIAARSIRQFFVYLWAILTAPWALIVAIHGLEIEIGKTHKPRPCELRCGDFHDPGEVCRLQQVGQCAECVRVVELDYFGNCPVSRYHSITNRRQKPQPKLRVVPE